MSKALSKIDIAEKMMVRPEGATMDEILAATGGSFQYNVKRRLEAKGYSIKTRKEGRLLRYFATPPAAQSFEATVTSKGQVTIPKEVRKRLDLHGGRKVRFTLEGGERATVTLARHSILDFVGSLPKPKRAATLEEMDEGIRQGAVERYLRSIE